MRKKSIWIVDHVELSPIQTINRTQILTKMLKR